MTSDPARGETLRGLVRTGYERVAGDYDTRLAPLFHPLGEELVRRAAVAEGAWVLDVAAGAGAVTLAAARAVGPGGHVICSDLSPAMLARAMVQVQATGLAQRVTFRELNAEALDLASASVDVVTCGFGLFFVPDRLRALSEMRRVLRPGGRVALSLWAVGALPPFRQFSQLLIAWGQKFPWTPEEVPVFWQPDQIAAELAAARFSDVHTETAESTLTLAMPDMLWDVGYSIGPARLMVDALGERADEFRAAYLAEVAPLFAQGPYALPLRVLYALAVR